MILSKKDRKFALIISTKLCELCASVVKNHTHKDTKKNLCELCGENNKDNYLLSDHG